MKKHLDSKRLHIAAYSCSILSALLFGSIFFFEYNLAQLREERDVMRHKQQNIQDNLQKAINKNEIARNLRGQLILLQTLKANRDKILMLSSEILEILRGIAVTELMMVKEYNLVREYSQKMDPPDMIVAIEKTEREVAGKITSYDTFKPIHETAFKVGIDYSEHYAYKIDRTALTIQRIEGNKKYIYSAAMAINCLALLFTGLVGYIDKKEIQKR